MKDVIAMCLLSFICTTHPAVFLGATILLKLLQKAYFYGSTVNRDIDGIHDRFCDYWIVHLFAPYVFINMTSDYVDTWYPTNYSFYVFQSVIALFLAIYLGDLIAGFVHFLGDVTQDYHFIYHHADPVYISQKSYVHHTYNSYYLAIPIYGILKYLLSGSPIWVWIQCIILIAVQGNECHHYAHCRKHQVGPIIAFLQRYNLFISPHNHKNHHKPPYDRDYCTITGWANPLLNRLTIPVCNSKYVKKHYPSTDAPTKNTYNPH